jgi:D-alanine-D-alanine ligase
VSHPDIDLREIVRPSDLDAVRDIVASTGFFSSAEVDVAVELVQERLTRGVASGYHFVFAERAGRTFGYACYGPIACTIGSFDLFWIAVHDDFRGHGLGRLLLRTSEQKIAQAGGRRIYIETSGRPQYEPTQQFYEHCGYTREAVLAEFYAPGDDKVVYCKALR